MLKENVIKLLEQEGITYNIMEERNVIYAYGTPKTMVLDHKVYDATPYIRMSNFEEDYTYVRDNGWCADCSNETLIKRLKELVK